MTIKRCVAALPFLLFAALTCRAHVTKAPEFLMRTLDRYSSDQAEPKIVGGTKAIASEWPATFVFVNPASQRPCSSTVIGDKVVLTAAHCIPDGARGQIELGLHKVWLTCSHHPSYNPLDVVPRSADFALCLLDVALPGGSFEHLSTKTEALSISREVHLLGFGCTQDFGTDRSFGTLYEGGARIVALPSGENYYFTTEGKAVCFGDSGGSAYIFEGGSRKKRLVIGVNSTGDFVRVSQISAAIEGFRGWANHWAGSKARICGLHRDATGCRVQ